LFHGRIHYVVAPNEGVTPLASIAPGCHGRKPIASHRRGRAASDSDRALDLIFSKRRRSGLEISNAKPREAQQIQRGRSRVEFGRRDRSTGRFVRRESRRFPWMILRASGLKRRQPVPRKAAATDDSKIRDGGFPSQKPDAEGRRKHSGVEVAKVAGRLACLLQNKLTNLQTNETGLLMAVEPPTIASLQSQGVPGFFVTCSNPMCLHSTPIAFETLSLDPSTPLPEIEKGRSFICPACGSRQISTLPHWSGRSARDADR
jgi:hypothetical protein